MLDRHTLQDLTNMTALDTVENKLTTIHGDNGVVCDFIKDTSPSRHFYVIKNKDGVIVFTSKPFLSNSIKKRARTILNNGTDWNSMPPSKKKDKHNA